MPNKAWKRSGTIAHAKREAIVSAFKATNYNFSAAAAKLEIGRTTLYRLAEKYEIELEVASVRHNHFVEPVVGLTIATASGQNGTNLSNHIPRRLEIRDGKLVLVGTSD